MTEVYTKPQNLTNFLSNDQVTEKVEIDHDVLCKLLETFEAPKLQGIQINEEVIYMAESDPFFTKTDKTLDFDSLGIKVTSYSDVSLEKQRWAWTDFMLADAFTILAGAPGRGKSSIAVQLMARLTKGELEGDLYGKPANVLYLSDEDSEAMIAKRLIAADADMSKVFTLDMMDGFGYTYAPTFPNNIDKLRMVIEHYNIKAVVLDSLSGFTGADVNSYNDDKSVRTMLGPLKKLGIENNCIFIGLMHFNKDTRGKDPLSNISGSGGFTRFARGVLVVDKNDHEDQEDNMYTLSVEKGSYSHEKPNLTYALNGVKVQLADGETEEVVKVTFLDRTSVSVGAIQRVKEDSDSVDSAQWLKEILQANDNYMLGTDLNERFTKEVGLHSSKLSSCKKVIGVISTRINDRFFSVLLLPGETKAEAVARVKEAQTTGPKGLLNQALS